MKERPIQLSLSRTLKCAYDKFLHIIHLLVNLELEFCKSNSYFLTFNLECKTPVRRLGTHILSSYNKHLSFIRMLVSDLNHTSSYIKTYLLVVTFDQKYI